MKCNLHGLLKTTALMIVGTFTLALSSCEVSSSVTRTRHISFGNSRFQYQGPERFTPQATLNLSKPKKDTELLAENLEVHQTKFMRLPTPNAVKPTSHTQLIEDIKIYPTENAKLMVTGRFQKAAQKMIQKIETRTNGNIATRPIEFCDIFPFEKMKHYSQMKLSDAIAQTLFLCGPDSNKLLKKGINTINTYSGTIVIYELETNKRIADFIPGFYTITDSSAIARVFYSKTKAGKIIENGVALFQKRKIKQDDQLVLNISSSASGNKKAPIIVDQK